MKSTECTAQISEMPADRQQKIVIDTQVIMDWLIFKNPSVSPLIHELQSGRSIWIALPAMKAELLHVLGRGVAADYGPDLALIDSEFDRWCHFIAKAPLPAIRLVCRDKDDQMFIDLALAEQAKWLISRDRAVLALAKRAGRAGLSILTPENWIRRKRPANPS